MRGAIWTAAGLAAALLCTPAAAAEGGATTADDDRYVGYYYPAPQDTEAYGPRVETLDRADQSTRAGFAIGLNKELQERGYAPRYAVFEKGDDSDTLIIVALEDGVLDTIYRARAVLASLTARARLLPVFQQVSGAREHLTFFDLCKLLGFHEIVISDGEDFAHRVILR